MRLQRSVFSVLVVVLLLNFMSGNIGDKEIQGINDKAFDNDCGYPKQQKQTIQIFNVLVGENFEIKEQVRYNSNKRKNTPEKESGNNADKDSREVMARATSPYNICMTIFLGIVAIAMLVLIFTAPKNKNKGE